MKTFPTYDNTLCNGGCCCRKETCVRYLTHLKAQKDIYPYPISYMMPEDNLVNEACDMYIKAE